MQQQQKLRSVEEILKERRKTCIKMFVIGFFFPLVFLLNFIYNLRASLHRKSSLEFKIMVWTSLPLFLLAAAMLLTWATLYQLLWDMFKPYGEYIAVNIPLG